MYSGWRGIYFNSLSGKDYPSVTKVNLYGNTKLYDSKGVLITKQQLADAIAVWKTKEQGSHKTYPCASTTGLGTTIPMFLEEPIFEQEKNNIEDDYEREEY